MDKMERGGGNKTHFIDVASIMPCQNSSWIMGSRIYGERGTKIPPGSTATIDLLAQDPGETGSILI